MEKCEKHVEMFGLQELKKDIATLKDDVNDPTVFWKKAAELRRKDLNFYYPDDLGIVELDAHPKVIKGLLRDSAVKSYHVREEMLDLIRDL